MQVEQVSGLAKNEILHVARSGFDAKGAREYGFFAALSYSEPEKEGEQPCFVVKNIADLLPILGVH